jgi:hypothetical protein
MAQYVGKFNVTNQLGQVVTYAMMSGLSHNDYSPVVEALARTIELNGLQKPKLLFLDTEADEELWLQHFPHLSAHLNPPPAHLISDLPLFEINSDEILIVLNWEAAVDLIPEMLRKLRQAGFGGLDAEWPVKIGQKGKPATIGHVALIQIWIPEDRVYLFPVAIWTKFPASFREFLADSGWKKAGIGIQADAKRINLDHSCNIKESDCVDLTALAILKGYARKQVSSLTLVVETTLRRHLEKPSSIRVSEIWDKKATYSNKGSKPVLYAAADAKASGLVMKFLVDLPNANTLLSDSVEHRVVGTEVDILASVDGKMQPVAQGTVTKLRPTNQAKDVKAGANKAFLTNDRCLVSVKRFMPNARLPLLYTPRLLPSGSGKGGTRKEAYNELLVGDAIVVDFKNLQVSRAPIDFTGSAEPASDPGRPTKESAPNREAPKHACCAGSRCRTPHVPVPSRADVQICFGCKKKVHGSCAIASMVDKDGNKDGNKDKPPIMWWHCPDCYSKIDAFTEVSFEELVKDYEKVYSRIKIDLWHVMDRIKVPRHHAFALEFYRSLRDAFLIYNKDDWDKVNKVLREKMGVSLEQVLKADPRWVHLYVRRFAPPPAILVPRLLEVRAEYSKPNKVDPATGKPLLDKDALAAFDRVIELAKKGKCSDNPNVPLYFEMSTNWLGLTKLRCVRGTNFTEGGRHRKENQTDASWNVGVRYADLLDLETTYVANLEAEMRNKGGIPDLGHRKYYFNDIINALSEQALGRRSFPWYRGCLGFLDTGARFGIQPIVVPDGFPTEVLTRAASKALVKSKGLSEDMAYLAFKQRSEIPYRPPTSEEEMGQIKRLARDPAYLRVVRNKTVPDAAKIALHIVMQSAFLSDGTTKNPYAPNGKTIFRITPGQVESHIAGAHKSARNRDAARRGQEAELDSLTNFLLSARHNLMPDTVKRLERLEAVVGGGEGAPPLLEDLYEETPDLDDDYSLAIEAERASRSQAPHTLTRSSELDADEDGEIAGKRRRREPAPAVSEECVDGGVVDLASGGDGKRSATKATPMDVDPAPDDRGVLPSANTAPSAASSETLAPIAGQGTTAAAGLGFMSLNGLPPSATLPRATIRISTQRCATCQQPRCHGATGGLCWSAGSEQVANGSGGLARPKKHRPRQCKTCFLPDCFGWRKGHTCLTPVDERDVSLDYRSWSNRRDQNVRKLRAKTEDTDSQPPSTANASGSSNNEPAAPLLDPDVDIRNVPRVEEIDYQQEAAAHLVRDEPAGKETYRDFGSLFGPENNGANSCYVDSALSLFVFWVASQRTGDPILDRTRILEKLSFHPPLHDLLFPLFFKSEWDSNRQFAAEDVERIRDEFLKLLFAEDATLFVPGRMAAAGESDRREDGSVLNVCPLSTADAVKIVLKPKPSNEDLAQALPGLR